jgi:hypothetical protein
MASYDALIAVWNTVGLPAGVSGTALAAGMSRAQKLNAINGWTVTGPARIASLQPSAILNAIVDTDLAALTTQQLTLLHLLLAGGAVNATQGSFIRLGIQKLFTGKTQTLGNLSALVAPFDSPTVPWTEANGYPPLNIADVAAAGLT